MSSKASDDVSFLKEDLVACVTKMYMYPAKAGCVIVSPEPSPFAAALHRSTSSIVEWPDYKPFFKGKLLQEAQNYENAASKIHESGPRI